MSKAQRKKRTVRSVTAKERSLRVVERRTEITQEDIAQRAYQLFLKRGCEDGDDVEDWLEAERQLHAERERFVTSKPNFQPTET